MSKPGKNTTGSGTGTKPAELPFEEALRKLEALVAEMESEELPLEALLARFEEGSRLTRVCQAKLAEAELKIQQLERSAAGEIEVKPIDTSPEEPI